MADVVVLGDSIVEGHCDFEKFGWVNRLQTKLSHKHNVYNLGISNSNTAELFQRMGEVTSRRPDILIVSGSVNDILLRKGIKENSFEISEMKRVRSWQKIRDFISQTNWKTVVIGPTPVDEDVMPVADSNPDIPEYEGYYVQNADVENYDAWLKIFCGKWGVEYYSCYQSWKSQDLTTLFEDGLHPNSKGHEMLAEAMFNKLNELNYLG